MGLKIKQVDSLQSTLDNKLNKNTLITGAAKTKITYDANGLVTAGADIAASDLPSNIDAAKIANGNVSNTEFQYLDGVTSAIQTQINSKAPTASPTFTGTVTTPLTTAGIVKTSAGGVLSSVAQIAQSEVTNLTGDLGNKASKIGSPTVGQIVTVATGGDIAQSGKSFNDSGTTTNDIWSASKVQTAINAVIGANDAMTYKGVQVCSANPNYPAGVQGDTWKVSVAGKIGGASGVNVEVGDMLICVTDNAGGTEASVGASWNIIQNNIDGAVTGPASVTADANIAVFNGTSGKIIKDSTIKIADIQSGATKQIRDVFTGLDLAAGNEVTIGNLSGTLVSNTKPVFTINGLAYDQGNVGALESETFGLTGTGPTVLKCKMPFAIETSDKVMLIYNAT